MEHFECDLFDFPSEYRWSGSVCLALIWPPLGDYPWIVLNNENKCVE